MFGIKLPSVKMPKIQVPKIVDDVWQVGNDIANPVRMLDDQGHIKSDIGNVQAAKNVTTAGNQPVRPEFISGLSGSAYNQLKDSAFNRDMNPWAKLAEARQNAVLLDSTEKGAQQVAAKAAEAEGNLAMRGGLSSGARERVQEGAGRNFMDMSQGLHRQNQQNIMNIGISDAEKKMQQQGQVTGMEQADMQARNDFNSKKYSDEMSAWAANKQADATQNAGGGKKGGGK